MRVGLVAPVTMVAVNTPVSPVALLGVVSPVVTTVVVVVPVIVAIVLFVVAFLVVGSIV